jgi:hypothetical protein
MSKGNKPNAALKEMRRTDAAQRQEAYDKKSPAEILASLDEKYGKGQGAKKVRAKLAKKLAKKA